MGWIPLEAPILFRFVVMLVALPWFVVLSRRVRGARDYAAPAVAFYLLCAAEVATVLERVLGLEVMDSVQHALYALAGIMAAVGAYVLLRSATRGRTVS